MRGARMRWEAARRRPAGRRHTRAQGSGASASRAFSHKEPGGLNGGSSAGPRADVGNERIIGAVMLAHLPSPAGALATAAAGAHGAHHHWHASPLPLVLVLGLGGLALAWALRRARRIGPAALALVLRPA